jgi:ATP-dependent protease ClpP protease subunit
MKKIILSGGVGWEIMPFLIREELEGVTGDIEFDLSSPGGSVFDGIEIFNIIRDYKRDNPDSQMILNIKGEAASMGSYLAANPAFDMVTIEDNATWMIHNPLMGVIGDYQEMEKGADFLKRLAALMATPYSKRSGKPVKEIREMMDSETWLFGKEIIKAGFADEIISTENKKSKATALTESEINFKAIKKKIQETEMKDSDFEKIAAMTKDFDNKVDKNDVSNNNEHAIKPATSGENNKQECNMSIKTIDDLQKELPEIHAEAIKAGRDQGINEEKERVKSLLEMKAKKDFEGIEMIHNRIDEAISSGETVGDVKLAIHAMSLKGDVQAAMDTNEIGDIDTPDKDTVSGEKKKEEDSRRVF